MVQHRYRSVQPMASSPYVNINFTSQDNNLKHMSMLCKGYLERKLSSGVLSIMEWTAQSPDLNPIELL